MWTDVNWLAILVTAVAAMVVGFLWYSPSLFGNTWMRAKGWDLNDKARMEEMKKGMGMSYFGAFLAALLSAYIISLLIHHLGVPNVMRGVKVGLAGFLGFAFPITLNDLLWGGKKELFWINLGHHLVGFVIMGAILGAWR